MSEEYMELNKNTVSADNQLRGEGSVYTIGGEGKGVRILFVGNSITLHGILPSIGWTRFHGMAASCEENDYVHRVIASVRKTNPDAAFCICQASGWETKYKNGAETFPTYAAARDFGADILIFRCIENCPGKDFDAAAFTHSLDALLDYLDPEKKAKRVITSGFWRHPGNPSLQAYAASKALPFIVLDDLGDRDDMKAVGLFEHAGVANHPGDKGMENIASRIYDVIKAYL